MLSWVDLSLFFFGFVGLCLIPVGLWRCAHGAWTEGWKGPRFRSGLRLLIAGPAVLFFLVVLTPRGYHRSRPQGQLAACKSNLKNIGTALEMYRTDHSETYPKALSQLSPNYLRVFPECPSAGKDTYSASYLQHASTDVEPAFFRVCCQGQHHLEANVKNSDRPVYDSKQGLIEL